MKFNFYADDIQIYLPFNTKADDEPMLSNLLNSALQGAQMSDNVIVRRPTFLKNVNLFYIYFWFVITIPYSYGIGQLREDKVVVQISKKFEVP